ncbi:MAG TPA: hypothetical protein VNZ64_18390 [Candidatus Acidoferrum sp.]|jgi:hypothetical protein|nr:hypothetical protein [Candidatus Acidoferrum sp.]
MNDDELKNLWQQQPLRNPNISAAQLISAMQHKTTQLRRDLRARDARELVACAFVILVFGYFAFNERSPIVRLGWLIVVGSSMFIAWKLVYARRTAPPAPPGATIVESLRAELNSVRTQSRLLGSVLWWYLLPPGIGLLVATWGMKIHLHAKIPSTLVFIAVYAFVYWLNQWARSKQLLPLEAQLESLLHSAETGEPLDDANVANLRPTVLSMAAADRVKPSEFKVAFWQLAIYGEIGFIGIWFILILALTEGKFSLMFNGQHLVWLVPFILAGLLYSWLMQKMTHRAVGLSTLGVHLQKGQNLILWDEIKEVRPHRFLNIRTLWLIRESAEKTMMPWTSLERHSDLKAAVEGFAPANHPIRKYLSLLR